jgi:hypothetical protein
MPKIEKLRKNFFTKNSRYILVLSIFAFFLLTLPPLINLLIPCLRPIPGQSYASSECTMDLAMNRYLALSLGIFALLIIKIFLFDNPRSIGKIGILALCMATIVVVGFLSYIPYAEREIKKAPITIFTGK